MTEMSFPDRISQQHTQCCLVTQFDDEGCELSLDGWTGAQFCAIGGTQYQSNHWYKGPLCDFLLFGSSPVPFVCALEMKGGKNLDAKHAVDQIQAGLSIAESNLTKDEIDRWYPILLHHRDAGNFWDLRLLASSKAIVKFHGDRRRVERHECGSHLGDIVE